MTKIQLSQRPHTTVILAMTADGKIADEKQSPARFGSPADKQHLEQQIALADGVLFGAGTLRAYGTTMSIKTPSLLQQRLSLGKPTQPVQIVVSKSACIDQNLRFFHQSVPRWLLTGSSGEKRWYSSKNDGKFERILVAKDVGNRRINWIDAFQQLSDLKLKRLAILGGGVLVASLLAANLIDELWLTVCPLIFGGDNAPTPVEGTGLLSQQPLQLLSAEIIEQEVFLHYSILRSHK